MNTHPDDTRIDDTRIDDTRIDDTRIDDTPGDDGLIADSVARLFGDHVDRALRERAEAGELDAALWRQVAAAGLPLMLATQAAGGLGLGWLAAYPVLRGLGHWQVPLPLAETMVAAQLLSLAGLPVPDPSLGPLTLIEQGQGNTLQAAGDGDGLHLGGAAHRVPWARHAQGALLSLRDGRLALLDLRDMTHGSGVTLQPHANHAGLPADTLVFSQARCVAVARNPTPLAQPVWTLGAVARSAMIVGALEWVLAQTVGYAGDRVQFGKPIGRNQAIQQNLALMAGDVAAARVAARVAAADASGADGAAAAFSAAVAKVRCGEAATRGTGIAHQVHGAIGFTHEHALHFATRRLWAWREEFGSDAHWAAELGRAAIATRAHGFWPALTARHFPSMS